MTGFPARAACCGVLCGSLMAAVPAPQGAAPSRIEQGLEEAVDWKWKVAPSPPAKGWGMPLPESPRPDEAGAAVAESRPATHEVKKGDALIKIARQYNMTVAQLKQFNGLKSDRIIIGEALRVPTPGELLAMEPPPPPKPDPAKEKDGEESGELPEDFEPMTPQQLELETVLIQVFLDRAMFSSGPIDGKGGPMLEKLGQLYQEANPYAAGPGQMRARALAEVKQPYTNYLLRAEDFRFIKPRKITPPEPVAKPAPKARTAKRKGAKPAAPPPAPPVTYEELLAGDFLVYTSAWEFVAERFHCDEAFLRRLNEKVADPPAAGTIFQVPNVIPFEIEKALDPPLQPAADPLKPVTAAVEDLSLLKIFREGKLIAAMPLASARPGLRGRGSWTILDAIPQPRMVTRHEPREAPAAGAEGAAAAAPPGEEQSLAAGPNNPVGIVWIHLAKAKSREPLPYGLHGTSIPGQMKSKEGIGGLRLANWDIARAVRLLPAGTPLQWPAVPGRKPRRR